MKMTYHDSISSSQRRCVSKWSDHVQKINTTEM